MAALLKSHYVHEKKHKNIFWTFLTNKEAKIVWKNGNLTQFGMWNTKRPTATSFSHVTSTNIGINPQNSLNSALSNYRNWTNSTHQKKKLITIFWWDPDKIQFLTNSFTEILELTNSGYMFWAHFQDNLIYGINLFGEMMAKIMRS